MVTLSLVQVNPKRLADYALVVGQDKIEELHGVLDIFASLP